MGTRFGKTSLFIYCWLLHFMWKKKKKMHWIFSEAEVFVWRFMKTFPFHGMHISRLNSTLMCRLYLIDYYYANEMKCYESHLFVFWMQFKSKNKKNSQLLTISGRSLILLFCFSLNLKSDDFIYKQKILLILNNTCIVKGMRTICTEQWTDCILSGPFLEYFIAFLWFMAGLLCLFL